MTSVCNNQTPRCQQQRGRAAGRAPCTMQGTYVRLRGRTSGVRQAEPHAPTPRRPAMPHFQHPRILLPHNPSIHSRKLHISAPVAVDPPPPSFQRAARMRPRAVVRLLPTAVQAVLGGAGPAARPLATADGSAAAQICSWQLRCMSSSGSSSSSGSGGTDCSPGRGGRALGPTHWAPSACGTSC